MKRTIKTLLSWLAAIAILVIGFVAVQELQRAKIMSADFYMETARVDWVIDGDTIKVTLLGDKETEALVRMQSLDAPESVHWNPDRNTEYGTLASEYTKQHLKKDEIVYLTKDVSDIDQYGRLLRFVWKQVPERPWNETELREKCYNAELIRMGYALAKSYEPDTSAMDLFFTLQEEAMDAPAGLWVDPTWAD